MWHHLLQALESGGHHQWFQRTRPEKGGCREQRAKGHLHGGRQEASPNTGTTCTFVPGKRRERKYFSCPLSIVNSKLVKVIPITEYKGDKE